MKLDNSTHISILTSKGKPNHLQEEGFVNLVTVLSSPAHSLGDLTFHIGMDYGDIEVAGFLSRKGYNIIGHPNNSRSKNLHFPKLNEEASLPMKERNQRLVEVASIIIGFPQYFNEFEDSPFWKTARFAMEAIDKDLYIISPAGHAWLLYDYDNVEA